MVPAQRRNTISVATVVRGSARPILSHLTHAAGTANRSVVRPRLSSSLAVLPRGERLVPEWNWSVARMLALVVLGLLQAHWMLERDDELPPQKVKASPRPRIAAKKKKAAAVRPSRRPLPMGDFRTRRFRAATTMVAGRRRQVTMCCR
jgi:hypothetical protein